ncbi:SDR family NAD(P)-dependent oxidoreductase [Seohaeicola zhoushanensis]|uniref:Short-chain dehydrogenase n=1 Tax=Seohaeicola zhoushanensis TaxID=1569283 RepID=A0A8J3MA75_9RHOB|nr:SDR family oxidoreductase [Seohaeicola zhoushanensis]GHF67129.1 short-chain dehydrogenase [Seohaeicola zhoushanensis]
MTRLHGKIALVTGGGSGIGAACVARFLAEGACVVSTDVTEQSGLASPTFLPLVHDVTDPASWQDVIARTTEVFGRLDILVNNAGVSMRTPATIMDTDFADWRRIIDVNLDGVFLGLKYGMRAMAPTGGAIVNMGSIHSFVAIPKAAGYCASKGGVLLLTRTAALEGAAMTPPVRVNSVHPGYVRTPLVDHRADTVEGWLPAIEAKIPARRLARPEEIAVAVLNLVTDDAAYMTGSAVTIDGGYTIL